MESEKIQVYIDYESFKDAYVLAGPFDDMIEELFKVVKSGGLTDSSAISEINISFSDGGVNTIIEIFHSLVRGINYWDKSRMQIKSKIIEFIENESAEKKSESDSQEDPLTCLRRRIDRAIINGDTYRANELLSLYESYQSIVLRV